MKIENSVVTMSAQSTVIEQYSKEESLKAWVGNEEPNLQTQNSSASSTLSSFNVKLDLSEEAKALIAKEKSGTSEIGGGKEYVDLTDKEKAKIKMLEDFLSAIMHKKIKLHIPDRIKLQDDKLQIDLKGRQIELQPPVKKGWGVEYESHEAYYEQQKMSFSSQGTIKTSDGREISFSVDLNMSREFLYRQDISFRAGDAVKIDPLVLNFNGTAPSLTNKKFSFDIDNDGKDNQISFVNPGSGFLALDKNNDGKINNGAELFGTLSGNGFSELAAYDSDNNHWIDENDPVFEKLRIWTKDDNGNDKLFALGEKGIGAIYLGNINSDFSMKDQSNNLQGEIKKSGIFVKENGSAGTVQHIDLAI